MWQYQNTDELYHYGRLGMKWGYHIFGDKYRYKSREQKKVVKQLKKLSKIGANKKNSDYSKLKNKLKRLKKRDNKELASYKKEVAKKRVQKITEQKTKQEEKKIKKKRNKRINRQRIKKTK